MGSVIVHISTKWLIFCNLQAEYKATLDDCGLLEQATCWNGLLPGFCTSWIAPHAPADVEWSELAYFDGHPERSAAPGAVSGGIRSERDFWHSLVCRLKTHLKSTDWSRLLKCDVMWNPLWHTDFWFDVKTKLFTLVITFLLPFFQADCCVTTTKDGKYLSLRCLYSSVHWCIMSSSSTGISPSKHCKH